MTVYSKFDSVCRFDLQGLTLNPLAAPKRIANFEGSISAIARDMHVSSKVIIG